MNMSAIRRTFLLSAFSLVLGTGLVSQAIAGEQLATIKKNGTLNVGLEGTYPPFSFVGEDGKWVIEEGEFVFTAGNQNLKVNCTNTKKWDTPNI